MDSGGEGSFLYSRCLAIQSFTFSFFGPGTKQLLQLQLNSRVQPTSLAVFSFFFLQNYPVVGLTAVFEVTVQFEA